MCGGALTKFEADLANHASDSLDEERCESGVSPAQPVSRDTFDGRD